ncbi:hypothetical protein C8R43DRAFT_1116263 [Mycena crocata]|nr:hypothetical protein C8R43DRAFT_1116263 [Mycena crocata]
MLSETAPDSEVDARTLVSSGSFPSGTGLTVEGPMLAASPARAIQPKKNKNPLFSPPRPLTLAQRSSSRFNPNIIRGPPSVILQATRSAASNNRHHNVASPYARRPNPEEVRLNEERARRAEEVRRIDQRRERERREAELREAERRARLESQSVIRFGNNSPVTPVPAPALTIRRRPSKDNGWRVMREVELTATDLYQTDARPPAQGTDRLHQRCSICLQIRSHGVSYACGHGHCYVCIRLWLEQQFHCPICRAEMHAAPIRHLDYDAGIEFDFPDRVDKSVVDYSWEGLRFPEQIRLVTHYLWEASTVSFP